MDALAGRSGLTGTPEFQPDSGWKRCTFWETRPGRGPIVCRGHLFETEPLLLFCRRIARAVESAKGGSSTIVKVRKGQFGRSFVTNEDHRADRFSHFSQASNVYLTPGISNVRR